MSITGLWGIQFRLLYSTVVAYSYFTTNTMPSTVRTKFYFVISTPTTPICNSNDGTTISANTIFVNVLAVIRSSMNQNFINAHRLFITVRSPILFQYSLTYMQELICQTAEDYSHSVQCCGPYGSVH